MSHPLLKAFEIILALEDIHNFIAGESCWLPSTFIVCLLVVRSKFYRDKLWIRRVRRAKLNFHASVTLARIMHKCHQIKSI